MNVFTITIVVEVPSGERVRYYSVATPPKELFHVCNALKDVLDERGLAAWPVGDPPWPGAYRSTVITEQPRTGGPVPTAPPRVTD